MNAELKNELKEIIFLLLTFPISIPMIFLLTNRKIADLGRKFPYHPRLINWVWSVWGRFFWLPCTLCGKNFGGNEPGGSLYHTNYSGEIVCRNCIDKANVLNKEKFGYG